MNQSNLFSSKYVGKSFLSSTMKDLSSLQSDKKTSIILKSFQKVQIQVKNQILDDLLQVYNWRSKMQLPIVKVLFYKVIQRNPDLFQTTIQVSYESCFITLSNMSDISIYNAIYLIRQSLVGFEKLFNVFGSFLISNKMIGINKNNRCKVWINQNFAVNQPIDVETFKNMSQKDFLQQLLQLFKKKTQKTKMTSLLFTELYQNINFQSVVVSIDNFAKINGLEAAKSYKVEQNNVRKNNPQRSPLKNPKQLTTNSLIGQKSKRIPQFLNKSQIGQSNDLNSSLLGSSKIISRVEKSKSNIKSGIRERTPLTQNRSQVNLYNPSISSISSFKSPIKNSKKQQQNQKLDYSFQNKPKSFSPLKKQKTHFLIESASPISLKELNNQFKENQFLNTEKKLIEPQQVIKSDVNTTHTNNSGITTRTRSILQKKESLFEVDRDLIQSIVIGNQHDKPKQNLFSTFDLQHLGKLGKNVIQSCMPEDFKH